MAFRVQNLFGTEKRAPELFSKEAGRKDVKLLQLRMSRIYHLQQNAFRRYYLQANHYLWAFISWHVVGCRPMKRKKKMYPMIM